MTHWTEEQIEAAARAREEAFAKAVDDATERCEKCAGTGYHHGFGEHGHDPDWCTVCGGSGYVNTITEAVANVAAMRAALATLPPQPAGGHGELINEAISLSHQADVNAELNVPDIDDAVTILGDCGRVLRRLASALEAQEAALEGLREASERRYFLDCEFDGHNGPLLSLALVGETDSIHIRTTERACDPWVIENVEPLMGQHDAGMSAEVPLNEVGVAIASFFSLMRDAAPVIVADSVVDIGRFCRALSTGMDGEWSSVDYPVIRFEVHDVSAYPTNLTGAVQHNAWWDAMALRSALGAKT